MITTSSAGAVENHSHLDGTANQWLHSPAESLHEAWRLGESESVRSRTSSRQRSRCRARCRAHRRAHCRGSRLGCRSAAPRSDRFGISRLSLRRGKRQGSLSSLPMYVVLSIQRAPSIGDQVNPQTLPQEGAHSFSDCIPKQYGVGRTNPCNPWRSKSPTSGSPVFHSEQSSAVRSRQ